MEQFTVVFKLNFQRNIKKVMASGEDHVIKLLKMSCINEEHVISIKNEKGERV